MTPSKLSELLSIQAESVCRYLLPGGKRKTADWVCGGLKGGSGDSLRVKIGGEETKRIGVWKDTTTGKEGNDFVDLWISARNVSLRSAISEIKTYLDIGMSGESSRPKREYPASSKPKCESIKPDTKCHEFMVSRRLNSNVVSAYKIAKNDRDEIVFPYLRHDHSFIGVSYSDLDCNMSRSSDGEPHLFGWHVIEDHHKNTRSAVLAGNEIDAMSLHQLGFPSLSIPPDFNEIGNMRHDWIESDFDELERFDLIYICMYTGKQTKADIDEVTRRLGVDRCRIVNLPSDADCINDLLVSGYTHDSVKVLLDRSKSRDPDELKSASVFTEQVINEFEGMRTDRPPIGIHSPWPSVGRRFMFRPGETTLWFGYSGHGKSDATTQVMAYALSQDTRWCVASMEMPARKSLHRLICQISGTSKPSIDQIKVVMAWLGDKLWLFDVAETAKSDRMLTVFDYAIKRYDIRHYIIDSLTKCGIDEDDFNGQKKLLDRITDMARRNGSHIHVVAHARKGEDERKRPTKHDVRGATAITDMVDNVVSVWRNKDSEEQGVNSVEVELHKQRHYTWEGRIDLTYNVDNHRIVDVQTDKNYRLPYIDYNSIRQIDATPEVNELDDVMLS